MPEVITDNLDLWTSALLTKSTAGRGSSGKLEAYGIKKLRELILELAVRGKLVPQDPSDEPASVLLEKIAKEKLRLIKEGEIRKEKPLPEIAEGEMDYELPSGWVFVRLGDVAYSQAGFAFKSNFFNENSDGLPLIRIRDVGQPFTGTYYSGEYREEFLVEKGDYLISMDGEFRVSPWTNGPALLNQRVSRLIFYYENVGQRFIADSLQTRLRELQGVKAYTTVDHLSGTQITEAVIGLPPLAEQHRIVAKVDELMALCDQLEQQQTHSIEAHQTLVASLLGTLTRVESQQEFSAAWARIASHFDTLFTTEASIDQLKQTILQLAVMGKLVPQDPNDEPARALLKRIQAEKAKLIAEGKIKKDKPLAAIAEDEKPFELPQSWEWVRLGEALNKITDGTHHSPTNTATGDFKYISAKNIKPWGLDLTDVTYVTAEVHQEIYSRCDPELGDVLYIKDGATTGIGTINSLSEPFSMLSSVALLKPSLGIKNTYLLKTMIAPLFYDEMRAGMTGVAITRVTLSKLNDAIIPLPPLAEQYRIVAKVDELMALCDILKVHLFDAQTTQLHLADAIVEQAVC